MLRHSLFFYFFLSIKICFAQSSFQLQLDDIKLLPGDIEIIDDNHFSGLFYTTDFRSKAVYALDFSLDEKTATGEKITIPGIEFYGSLYSQRSENEKEKIFQFLSHDAGANNAVSMVYFDKNTGGKWVRRFPSLQETAFNSEGDDIFIAGTFPLPDGGGQHGVNTYLMDKKTGEIIHSKAWNLTSAVTNPSVNFAPRIISLSRFDDTKNYVVSGYFQSQTEFAFFLAGTDERGNLKQQRVFQQFLLRNVKISSDGSIYCVGTYDLPGRERCGSQFAAAIIKMDRDFNIIWAKSYDAGNVYAQFADIDFLADNSIILFYGGRNNTGSVFLHLQNNGDLIKAQGLATESLVFATASDSSFLIQTGLEWSSNGFVSPKSVITKTDYLGNVENCINYPTDITVATIDIPSNNFPIDSFDFQNMKRSDIVSEPVEFTISGSCDSLSVVPEFEVPDTICVGDILKTENPFFLYAYCGDWVLRSDDVFSVLFRSKEFTHTMTLPGTYTLELTTEFLGIPYSVEKVIEVLDPPEVTILPDSILCDLPPAELHYESSRPLLSVEWNTGDTLPMTFINEGGTYSLTGQSRFCPAAASTSIDFIFEKIDTHLALTFPEPGLICLDNFPFELRPESKYSTIFEKDDSQIDSVFLLSNIREYQFSTTVLGCKFSRHFDLALDDCEVKIFAPSAFSPNNDGINDEFIPLGKDIEPIRLKIYDRWGGKVFVSNGSQLAWNGKFDDKPVGSGVYVFRFEYVNLLTGLEEEISGEVAVMR